MFELFSEISLLLLLLTIHYAIHNPLGRTMRERGNKVTRQAQNQRGRDRKFASAKTEFAIKSNSFPNKWGKSSPVK